MTLASMKRRYGQLLLNSMERFSFALRQVDRPVFCCVSLTHPVAEAFHRCLCTDCTGTVATCPLFSGDLSSPAITGITTAKVLGELVAECPLTAHLQRAFADRSAAGRAVFWCADDAFEIADVHDPAVTLVERLGELAARAFDGAAALEEVKSAMSVLPDMDEGSDDSAPRVNTWGWKGEA
jgi:hypothetical protein